MAADPSLMCKISGEEIKNFLRIPLGDIKKASLDFDQIPEDDKKANVINRMGILKKLKKTPFVLCMDELHLPYLKPEEVAERDDDDGPSTSKKAKVQVRSSILVVLFQSLDCKEMAVIYGKMLSKRDVYNSDLVLKVMIYMERYLRMANIEKNCVGFVLDNCNVNASARKLYKGAIPIVWDYLHFANVSVNTYGHIDRTLFETYNSEFLAGDYRETVESIYDKYAMPPNLIPQYMEEKEAILRILLRLFALRKPENQPQSRRITHISNYFIELLGKYILNTGHQYVEAAKAAFKSELFDEKI